MVWIICGEEKVKENATYHFTEHDGKLLALLIAEKRTKIFK
jgi:hypothetical protein